MSGVPVGEIARGIARRFGCGDEAPLVRPVEEIVVELGEWARGYALDQRMSSEKTRRNLGWEPTRVDVFGAFSAAVATFRKAYFFRNASRVTTSALF
ncbi:hypothetical protein [Rhodospirillaceae bacterium SYSU D60014]|uniref:hypothetical protein n=1 Tax=Virgifigura deserti TaxID=2268457 RepID=UPI000E66B8EB